MTNLRIKHYALPTRQLARLYTNLLKGKGYNTTQPRVKTGGAYLVSTCTKFKKPTPKKVFNVVNRRVVEA